MAEVVFRNVSKVYEGGVVAVQDFNLTINDKEFCVLVGPSGCGKTTTLRMLAGLEDITSGEILIDGVVVNNKQPKDRDIAMVFQNYALYPHMTVYDNMAFGLKLRNYSKEEIKKRVNEAAQILGLTEYLNRKPKALSGGQRQRVAIGRVITRKPKVFLFDEPLSNLDAKLRVQMRTEISKLHQKLNTTFIYVTHDQTEALTMGTRIVVMKDGFVQQIDNPQKLYDEPVNIFVAGFIGSPQINFANGVVEKTGDKLALVFGDYKLALPSNKAELLEKQGYVGKEIVFGIRPEDIHDEFTELEDKQSCALKASVEVTERLGSETFLYLIINGLNFTARVSPKSKTQAGEEVSLVFDMARVHLFDKETEKAITH